MSKNSLLIESFYAYCKAHPEERFWQALRNWSGYNFILASESNDGTSGNNGVALDTFYWESKDK